MKITTTAVRAAALVGAAALALTACSSSGSGSDESSSAGGSDSSAAAEPLKIGSLLPQTGSLAFLGPPEIAGVNLAVQEINDAGGVLGSPVEHIAADSSDADHADVAPQSWSDLQSQGVSAVVGAASSSVTKLVVDDITNAKVVMISPANTATSLSGYSPFYFRTAPPDTVQGSALGNLIVSDGITDLGILVFNEEYGTSLRDVIQTTVEAAGVNVTYGKAGEEFDPTQGFQDAVTAIMATNPKAIALVAFDQTKSIVPLLVAAGFQGNLYMVDGNTADYSADFDAGTLAAWKTQGTIPGAFPDDAFKERLLGVDSGLEDYSYAAESYDATILVALAALKGGATDGETIQANLAAVSGANGGEKCTGFQACADLIADGQDIDYEAVSGAGPFNADNDPSSAFIGIYQYNDDNTYTWVKAVEGAA